MTLKVRDWRWKYRWYVLSGGLALSWTIVVGIGRFAWKWGQSHEFRVHSDGWFAKRPDLDGGSDKFGHMYAMYALERGFTYIFESLGIPHWVAVLASSINSALSGVAIELGDGFTAAYGFSSSDIAFDLMGTALGLVQDLYPPLRNVFALSYWYWPSSGFLSKRNPHKEKALTDYSGSKYFFHILGSGIPYVKDTPFRYLRFDLGFWSRGFKEYDKDFPYHMHQYFYLGLSVDFAKLVWDLFPHEWYRTSTYVFLKYFNLYGPFETGYKFKR